MKYKLLSGSSPRSLAEKVMEHIDHKVKHKGWVLHGSTFTDGDEFYQAIITSNPDAEIRGSSHHGNK